jgi:hypothetical protein
MGNLHYLSDRFNGLVHSYCFVEPIYSQNRNAKQIDPPKRGIYLMFLQFCTAGRLVGLDL